jgi:hypothetical protein
LGVAGVLFVAVLSGCSGSDAAGPCRQPVREELDPGHLVHVIDPTTARFKTNPPTSGPHIGAGAPTGAVDQPILGAVQTAILERGDVLIQYRDLDADAVEQVRSMAGDHTVIAPNPDLPAPVIATAWTYKLTCDAVDTNALGKFVRQHAGQPVQH